MSIVASQILKFLDPLKIEVSKSNILRTKHHFFFMYKTHLLYINGYYNMAKKSILADVTFHDTFN